MAKQPKVARSATTCTKCGETIPEGQTFVWHNYPAERKAGRSGMAHPACAGTPAPAPSTSAPAPADASSEELQPLRERLDVVEKLTSEHSEIFNGHTSEISKIRDAVEGLKANVGKTIEVKTPAKPEGIIIESVHPKFEELLNVCNVLRQAYVWGPAGTGKTTMGRQVAEALDLDFYYIQLGKSPESRLTGYPTADGGIFETDFRRAYINGGVVLLDELDSTLPTTSILLNGAIENGRCGFPDGQYDRHPDCIIIGAGNTPMLGADEDYSARSPQDAAFRERFAFIRVDLDEGLERKMVDAEGAGELGIRWLHFVRKVRTLCATHAPQVLVTPRASKLGAKLLAQNPELEFRYLLELLIFKGAAAHGSDLHNLIEEALKQ